MIEVSNLVKVFEGRGQTVRAVDDVSTAIAKGEVVVIGKSTKQQAFNCLAHGDPDMGEN